MARINKKRVYDLLFKTLSFDTTNPPGQEQQLARYLKEYLRQYALPVRLIEYSRARTNLLVHLRSAQPRKTIVCSPHLDTVPAPASLLHPYRSNGRIIGRGASDCKGNLCAVLEALIVLKQHYTLRHLDVIVCATADEEAGSKKGLIPLLDHKAVSGDFWLILDSDAFEIITAQKGLFHFKISFRGRSAHASVPEKGKNAILDAARVVHDLTNMPFAYRKHPLLRPPTINVGTIHGGDKVNMVPSACTIEVDIRYLPGMRIPDIIHLVKKTVRRTTSAFTLEVTDIQEPIEHNNGSYWIKALKNTLKEHHVPVKIRGSEGATIMSILNRYGFESVSFGFGVPHTAHSLTEHIYGPDVCRGAQILYDYLIALDEALS